MKNEFAKVKIYPDKKEVIAKVGSRLIDILWENNIEIEAFCGGERSCGKCIVKLLSGETNSYTEIERSLLSENQIKDNIVLSCEKTIIGDIEIELVNEKKEIKDSKSFYINNMNEKLDPIVEKHFLQLEKPTIKDQRDDLKRILDELGEGIEFEKNLVMEIPNILRANDYNITATVFENKLIKVEGGDSSSENYSIVIDLGTTTVAGYLVDMTSGSVVCNYSYGNLQKSYGADVISRINYSISKDDGISKMKDLATQSIDNVIEKLISISGVDRKYIYLVMTLGNTVMSHLLVGASPIGVAKSPFAPAFTSMIKSTSTEMGIKSLMSYCKYIVLPNVAGYVGSDTLGVIDATDIINLKGNWLAIDIGTNCELVLKSEEKLLTCSTAAGPAFEGACMSQGMRAESGAIYKFNIELEEDNYDMDISTIGNEEPKGICGSGYIDIVSQLVKAGLISKQGRILSKEKLESKFGNNKIKEKIKKSNIGYKFMLAEEKNQVAITQEDISQLQLAKGAVRAGIEILLKEANIQTLDGILLAGAFGSNVRVDSVIRLGMLPEIEIDEIQAVGNASGSGGIKMVLSKENFESLKHISKKIEHVELSLHKDFSNIFARSMPFNNKKIEKVTN